MFHLIERSIIPALSSIAEHCRALPSIAMHCRAFDKHQRTKGSLVLFLVVLNGLCETANRYNFFVVLNGLCKTANNYKYFTCFFVSLNGSVETTKSYNVSLSGFSQLQYLMVSVFCSTQWFQSFVRLDGFSFLQYLIVSVFCRLQWFQFFVVLRGFGVYVNGFSKLQQ